MTEQKLKEVFVSNNETSPVFEAFMFVIHRLYEDSVYASITPSLPDSDRAYNCGRAASIKDLEFMIRDYCDRKEEE